MQRSRPRGQQQLRAVLTVPNFVTLLRLAAVPVFAWLLVYQNQPVPAAVLLGLIASTDWLDGYLARHLRQVSEIGKILDPLVDRVLIAVAVLACLAAGDLPVWLALVLLLREVGVVVGAAGFARLGVTGVAVIWAGKAGTFAMMLSLPFFIVAHSGLGWKEAASAVAWTSISIGIVLGWVAGLSYMTQAKRALGVARARRSG